MKRKARKGRREDTHLSLRGRARAQSREPKGTTVVGEPCGMGTRVGALEELIFVAQLWHASQYAVGAEKKETVLTICDHSNYSSRY